MKMNKRTFIAAVAAAAVLVGCGGSSSNSGESETTIQQRTKNDALPTTTAAASSTPVVVKVSDPGNFAPTYLASTDVNGAPRPALPAESLISNNAAKSVSGTYATDSAGVLTVSSAQWVGDSSPMTLRWTVGGIACDNCAFLSSTTKKVVKALLATTFAGSGIKSIRGVDPTATAVGQFLGNGWGVEVLIGDSTNTSAVATGNAVRDWALNCTGGTAATCRNVDLGIGELRWKNQIWSVADCTSALQNGGPKLLFNDLSKALKGADAATANFVRQRAAIDRVVIATPSYRPIFSGSGDARAFTGFASTGWAK